MVYTNGFTAFKDARTFASYCGVAPFSQSSGSSIHKKARVSSMGYRKIKALLTNAVWNSINFDKEIRAYWLRKCEEGKEEGVVLNAIKFKIIARVFAVVKRGVPFVPLENYRAEISK